MDSFFYSKKLLMLQAYLIYSLGISSREYNASNTGLVKLADFLEQKRWQLSKSECFDLLAVTWHTLVTKILFIGHFTFKEPLEY